MNVLSVVLIIALGTAILAALIVAADWDLAVIHAWENIARQKPEPADVAPVSLREASAPHPRPEERPATPLRDVLAARRDGRPCDTAA